ncbi:hypothetical protein SO802_017733 [Lithocarpus litseifolius]|uniref:Uncharacterized protein n=1 Tax=Lithocarpus litseifolius TaxID=425828 RepID=A0AAW2CNP6_9ROSI
MAPKSKKSFHILSIDAFHLTRWNGAVWLMTTPSFTKDHNTTFWRVQGPNRVLISLEDKSGTRLGAELLGRRNATETIHYTVLEVDFMHHPQGTAEECTRMAKALPALEGDGLRVIYLTERVCCQLAGEDMPQVPIDPLEFMLAPHSMTNVEYDLWGPGIPFTRRVTADLDSDEFSGTHLMPSLIAEEHEELIWLARNLKLELTEYSRQLYGGKDDGDDDDDDDGGDNGDDMLKVQSQLQAISQGSGASDDPTKR